MQRPENYQRLPDGVKCRCIKMWRDADGSLWCCKEGATTEPQPDGSVFLDPRSRFNTSSQ